MATAASLKTQKPEAASRMAWCRPPEMLTACCAVPLVHLLGGEHAAAGDQRRGVVHALEDRVVRRCRGRGRRRGSAGRAADRLEVGRVVHQGEQVDVRPAWA